MQKASRDPCSLYLSLSSVMTTNKSRILPVRDFFCKIILTFLREYTDFATTNCYQFFTSFLLFRASSITFISANFVYYIKSRNRKLLRIFLKWLKSDLFPTIQTIFKSNNLAILKKNLSPLGDFLGLYDLCGLYDLSGRRVVQQNVTNCNVCLRIRLYVYSVKSLK